MTEKRYTHNILGSVFKDGKLFALTEGESQARTLCIELNELDEENEQLKAHYNSLSHNNGLLHDEYTNKIDALKKEKEKIKQQRDFYYARLQKIIKVANGDWE